MVDRTRIPLAIGLTTANRPDGGLLAALVDTNEPIKRPRGRPRRRPAKLHADKGYDYPHRRATLRRRGITSRIVRKAVESKARPGRFRRIAARIHARIARVPRLAIRHERREDIHQARLDLGYALLYLAALHWPPEEAFK